LSADCRLTVTVRAARDQGEIEAARRLRVRVFCEEQGVPREKELDGLDDAATHLIALDEKDVLATCRLRMLDRSCKLERMAVEGRFRDHGVGSKLLDAAEQGAAGLGAEEAVVHAQRQAEGFYARRGYSNEGKPFSEAGIEHVRMVKRLRPDSWS
jgi:predicted GNAT family N-acyltransferase